jgi:hypothetical protein
MAAKSLLTVELAPGYDIVHICGNKAGLKALAKTLSDLAEQGGEKVLQTETYGGTELGQASQLPAARLIHKLNVHVVKR